MALQGTPAASRKDNTQEGPFGPAPNLVERMPMLRVVLERLAEICGENLRGASSQPVHILLKGIDVGPVGDMIAALDGASIAGVLNTPKWDSRLLAVADRAAVFALIEMLLGGDGSQPPYSIERPLTKLETKVMGAFFHRMGQALGTAFAQIAATAVVVEACSERFDFDAVGGRSTQVVVARFRVEVWDRAGEFLLAIPRAVLAPMRETLSRAMAKDAPKIDPVWSQRIQSEIKRTSVSIRAVLDERWITLAEVAALKVGQVMPLNATPSSRVRVECNDQPLLWCQLGKSNGVYTLRVDEFIDPQQEFMDDILFG